MWTKIRKAIQYIYIGIVAIPGIAFYHFFFNVRYAKNPSKYPFEKRYKNIKRLSKLVLFAYRSKYQLYNLDEFNKASGQTMIVANHLSDLDPLVVAATFDRPVTFIAKKEAMDFPFVGTVLKALEAFPIDRDNVVSQFSTIKKIVTHLKDESKPPVVVFIEGTRNKNPETDCLDFHPGTLKIAQMANVPVIPVSLYGTFRHLTLKSYLHHYPVFVDAGKTVSAEEVKSLDLNEFAKDLQKQIDDKVDEFRKIDQCFIYGQWLTRRRKALETIVDLGVKS